MANTNNITFEIVEHIGVIDTIDNREEKWTKEVNVVAWNGGKPKIDVRDWNSSHDRMSRGISNLLGFDESKFKITTGIAGACGTLLAALGLLNAFQGFLSLMSGLIPSLAGVIIAE